MARSVAMVKRLFDIVLSFSILFLGFPVILLIAFLIKLDSKGPVLYTQQRVGRHKNAKTPTEEHVFSIYKFRSMVVNAEQSTGAILQQLNDPRITRIGRLLRRTRLDELPNLINVLKGDMSIIGPRADRLELLKPMTQYLPLLLDRTKWVRPGITGLAQVKLRYDGGLDGSEDLIHCLPESDATIPENITSKYKSYYDFAYVFAMDSFMSYIKMELYILVQTPITMFIKKNPQ